MIIQIFTSSGELAVEFTVADETTPREAQDSVENISLVLINEGNEYADVRYSDSLAFPGGFAERRLPATRVKGVVTSTVVEVIS